MTLWFMIYGMMFVTAVVKTVGVKDLNSRRKEREKMIKAAKLGSASR